MANTRPTLPPPPPGQHAPPAVIFTTTPNTIITQGVVDQAIMWQVGVWQRRVFYDANSATPNNPLLHLGDAKCLTSSLYPTLSVTWIDPGASWPDNPLTWVTVEEQRSAGE